MTWDWASPMATAVVGLAGIYGTYRGTSRQSDTAIKVAEAQIVGDLEAKDRERVQSRIATAYADLARWMSIYGAWAMRTMPMAAAVGYDPFPLPPGLDDPSIHDAESLAIYWSDEVSEFVKLWADARNKLVTVSGLARSEREDGNTTGGGNLWILADQHRKAMNEAEAAAMKQIRKELRATAESAPNGAPSA